MMHTRRTLLLGAAGTAGLTLSPTRNAHAAGFPERPVTIVVSFAPGGMTDLVGRLLATELTKSLGQPFVVENRAGAAGQVGTEYVARRAPDGYTLLISATGHVIGPAVQTVRYRPVDDFAPIAPLARAPNLLLVHKSVPAQTVPEALAWIRSQPEVPYGSAGVGGSTHLAGETLRVRGRLPMVHVPYRGASPAITDLVAGQIKLAFQDSMSAAPFLASGDIRAIAVTTLERSELFPEVPTLHESGFPGFDLYTWLGFYAPARTDAAIVQRLNEEASRIITTPEARAWLRQNNSEPGGARSPDAFRDFVAAEVHKWAGVVRDSGIRVE